MLKLINNTGYPMHHDYNRMLTWAKADFEAGTVEALHRPFSCKDYFTEALVFDEEGRKYESYVHFYKDSLHKDHTIFLFTCMDDLKDTWFHNLDLFRKYEKELGLTPTEIIPTDLKSHYVVKGDKWWMNNTVAFSLYVSWLRNCMWKAKCKNLDNLQGDIYIFRHLERIKVLLPALRQITPERRRNAPTQSGMHGKNGHFWFLQAPKEMLPELQLYKAVQALIPDFWKDNQERY